MEWKKIERIAQSPDKQWYLNQIEVAALLGRNRRYAAAFLADNSVPWYRTGKEKMYFLPEVLEAIEKTKWKDKQGA